MAGSVIINVLNYFQVNFQEVKQPLETIRVLCQMRTLKSMKREEEAGKKSETDKEIDRDRGTDKEIHRDR